MRINRQTFFILCLVFLPGYLLCQQPDISKIADPKEKINVWLSYCESLRLNSAGKNNFPALQQAALKGVNMTPFADASDRSRFFFYAAFGCYYQVKFDSAQYYFYQSLHDAQKANSAEFIADACVALIPVNFQLQQQAKVDSCKNILQTILDTTHNESILRDGYSAMGSYYQQKAYYSTAQDYFIKSIEIRKKEVDTTKEIKLKADYAIQCYQLSKQYQNTDVLDKSLDILKEGQPYAGFSPPVSIRYLSSFTEIYSLLGNIDSALYYEKQLEEETKNSPVVPSEMVSANLNIAKYYIEHKQASKAFPYVSKADTLAGRSKSPILNYQAQLWKGRYFEESGKFEQAISSLSQSLPIAKQISKEQYTEGLKYMAQAQKGAGNLNEAIQYYEEYIQQSDSLTKEKISRNLADQETRYETNQKEQRIVSLSKENQLRSLELRNASRTRLFLILGLVALGVIALLLYFIYRNKEKLNKILNERNAQLDVLNHELSVANDTKAKLFGIIGHDLRSPIGQIVQLLQLQKEKSGLLTEESRTKHEQRLQAASENVLETMEDLLLWSKSQMKHFTPQYKHVRIADILEREINFVHPQAEQKNIRIEQQVPDNFTEYTDENFLSVIIRNLLQNAVKYSDNAGTINVSSKKKRVIITNQSSKVNAEELNALLHAQQIDSKRSGLGLQIVNDLALSVKTKIFYEQPDNNRISAVLEWE
ncbi:MAG: ATP-binding protein [Chitinophagales bacterium]